MQITLEDLFKREIFESYTILTAKKHLNRGFQSVSILETPDFENYIIEKSLILTTFYPIKTEVDTFKKLLFALNKKDTAGILIKMNRYIDKIPIEILELSEQLNLPIVALYYDANLSLLFNNILSELQSQDYSNYAFDTNYSQFLKQVYEYPTTKTLIEVVDKIPDLELLIQNSDNKTLYYTSDEMHAYFEQFGASRNLFQRIGETIYYSEDVIYDDKPIYNLILMANKDKRHILHNYMEIFKLMIIVIHQKKVENSLKQNQFLLNFVSNLSSKITNSQLIEATRRYNWKINFPVILLLFSIRDKNKHAANPNLLEYVQTVIITKFHLNSEELRFTLLNDQILFIVNTLDTVDIAERMQLIYDTLKLKYKDLSIILTYSNLIHDASHISKTYFQLSDALTHIETKNLDIHIFSEDKIKLLNLLKNIDYVRLREYIYPILKKLIDYERKNNTPLIDTLLKHIECKFNSMETAKKLFIHYNTVRYRLDVIHNLGINVIENSEGYFDLYFALYLYKNFETSDVNM